MKLRWIAAFILTLSLACYVLPRSGEAAGPWKAQVVDAETGKPLEGAVVLSVWYRHMRGLGVHGTLGYGASEEVVTDNDGRFTISTRSSFTFNPFVYLEEAKFYIFKPGHGQWRFKGEDMWLKLDTYERNMRYKEAWEQFTGDGVVIELPPLKTREERLKFYQGAFFGPPGDVPRDQMKSWTEAEHAERAYLGFRSK